MTGIQAGRGGGESRGRGRGRGRGPRGAVRGGRGGGQRGGGRNSRNSSNNEPTNKAETTGDGPQQNKEAGTRGDGRGLGRGTVRRGGRGQGRQNNDPKTHTPAETIRSTEGEKGQQANDKNGQPNNKNNNKKNDVQNKGNSNKQGSKDTKNGGSNRQGQKMNDSTKDNKNDANKKDTNKTMKESEKKNDNKNNKQNIQKKNDNKQKAINNKTKDQKSPYALAVPPNQPQQTNDINYKKGQTITVFHVAEKPSIAQAIAKGLSAGSISNAKGGKSMPMYEFADPPFPKAPHASKCKHRVSSVAGHVFSVDFPSKFQSWDSVDPAELFTAPIVRKPGSQGVIKNLEDGARGADFIVLWMDCDREGENINFEVLDCCMHLMQFGDSASNFDRVYRAHFSAINPSDIKKAYKELGKPDKNQALSVDARQELDLKVGVAFSRFQTRYFQGRYGDLDSAVLSYGPCQTPTLQFCVKRLIDIETFKPEPYWVLELNVIKRGRSLQALWNSGRSFNKDKVENLLKQAMEQNTAVKVANIITKEKKQGRPTPLNTVSLLKACSKALGIGPHAAMQTAERLYLSGYLSYPRTESTAYPKSFDIRGTLEMQASDGRWGKIVRDMLQGGVNKSRGGVDMGDHPPITPVRAAGPSELSGDMARVYDLVVRHFIASVSTDAVWQSTAIEFELDTLGDKGKFSLRGKELMDPGFLAIVLSREYGEDAERQDDEEDEEERSIPEFKKGEIIPLAGSSSESSGKVAVASSEPVRASLLIREKKTTPPSLLTESELIGLMEKHGIGTDASIPTHIENIQKRNYCLLESGRRLRPSKLGIVLVQGYHKIDSSLVLPTIRSDIEGQCNKIAKGFASKDDVVEKAIQLFSEKFDFFVKNIGKMDILFGSSFSKLEEIGKPFTRCGLSRRYLQYIPGPPPRLYNKYTETVYPLPVGGIVKQWAGRLCPVEGCNFELCLYSVGQPQRTFPFCPYCFNNPDWALDSDEFPEDRVEREDKSKEKQIKTVAGKMLTLECPLPDHHPLIEEMTVSPDPDTDGVLILDPHLGPKWRLVATRAPTIVHLPQEIDKITLLDKKDDVLGCHLMKVKFKDGKTPTGVEDGSSYDCCFATDQVLQSLVRVHYGTDRLKASGGRGGRGRGRGRGKGGRGGGRGGRR